jgi:hypothetical protein
MTHQKPPDAYPLPESVVERLRQEWPLPQNRINDLDDDNDATARNVVSQSALEFFKLVSDSASFSLATAARMSATFPFVSPAVNLPTDPPLRVVDAGYYDNYGVTVAASWIRQNRQWIRDNTSGVLVVQIRDALSKRDRSGVPSGDPGFFESFFQGLQLVSSVTDGVAKARYSTNAFRNDEEIGALAELFRQMGADRGFLATVNFENSARVSLGTDLQAWPGLGDPREVESGKDVAMSWAITRDEIEALEHAIPIPGENDASIYTALLQHARARDAETRNSDMATYATLLAGAGVQTRVDKFAPRPSADAPAGAEEAKALLESPDGSKLTARQKALLRLAHIAWLNDRSQFNASREQTAKTPQELRDYYALEFERAMNYERIEALARWWKQDHATAPPAPEKPANQPEPVIPRGPRPGAG